MSQPDPSPCVRRAASPSAQPSEAATRLPDSGTMPTQRSQSRQCLLPYLAERDTPLGKRMQGCRLALIRTDDTTLLATIGPIFGSGNIPILPGFPGYFATAGIGELLVSVGPQDFGPVTDNLELGAVPGPSDLALFATALAPAWFERGTLMRPSSAKCPCSASTSIVRCRIRRSRVQCNISTDCCAVAFTFTATKRIDGRLTAAEIASASAASFLLRLT
jgi:hypothetical protein